VATGAVVPPGAFGTSGLCGTGLGGAGRSPDASGNCPLVYMVPTNGTGAASIVDGIVRTAGI